MDDYWPVSPFGLVNTVAKSVNTASARRLQAGDRGGMVDATAEEGGLLVHQLQSRPGGVLRNLSDLGLNRRREAGTRCTEGDPILQTIDHQRLKSPLRFHGN